MAGGGEDRGENPIERLRAAETDAEVCRVGVDVVEGLLGSPAWIVAAPTPGRVETAATTGTDADAGAKELPVADCVLRHIVDEREPRIVDDLADTRGTTAATTGRADRRRSCLLVPIDGWGLVVAAEETPGAFDDDDLAVAAFVADVLAAFLQGASRPARTPAPDRLDEIAGILSHDLSNPIAIARSWVDHAIETGETDRLEDAAKAIDRIEELTSSVERYARTGRPIEEPDVVDLGAVARGAWSVVETERADLQVEGTASLLADESRLRELLENVFRNAVVHGPPGVTVRVGPLDDEGGPVVGFYVEDDGDGIPPERRDSVLEYGFSTESDRSGYGLGIVAGIVEAHGWRIDVVTGEAGGARFEVSGVEIVD